MRGIRGDAIASLAMLCLALLACGIGGGGIGGDSWEVDIPRDECADDARPGLRPLPSACATLSGIPDEVIGTDGGWLLARFSTQSVSIEGDGGQLLQRAQVSVETEVLAP